MSEVRSRDTYQAPPAEIRFDLKGGDVVIVYTRKLTGGPYHLYEARWMRSEGGTPIVLETMSWPSEADIKAALNVYKTSRKS